jgi:hypothetical protein
MVLAGPEGKELDFYPAGTKRFDLVNDPATALRGFRVGSEIHHHENSHGLSLEPRAAFAGPGRTDGQRPAAVAAAAVSYR